MAWVFVLVLPFMVFSGAYCAVSERLDRIEARKKRLAFERRNGLRLNRPA